MTLIVTSEMRVGSRWVHYLLGNILQEYIGPEVAGQKLFGSEKQKTLNWVKLCLSNRIIPKFHGIGAITLSRFLQEAGVEDFFVVGVARNPYDRAVSLAFHNRYSRKPFPFKQKDVESDEEAVIWTATNDTGFYKSCIRQGSEITLHGYSTFSSLSGESLDVLPYVWTTYEWLKEDTAGEIQGILRKALRPAIAPRTQLINEYVNKHSFQSLSGRKAGDEKRDDQWHRKGVLNDHENWFTDECYEKLSTHQHYYNWVVNREKLGKTDEIPRI